MIADLMLSFKLYALAIVISLLVAVMIKGIVVVLTMAQKKPKAKQAPEVEAAEPPEPAVSDIPAIAAAVYAVMGAHRIVHIERGRSGASWIHEGRILHQTSHAIQHAPKRK